VKIQVLEDALNLCGYFCIVTSENMTAEQALILYKGRDASEKLFSGDKTFLGGRSMRVHTESAISAKIFIEFIALIVRNRIYTLLKEQLLRMESRPNYMTVPDAVRELEKIEMIRRNNGIYRLDHAVTKRQKTILNAFGLDEQYVRIKAAEIGRLLADGGSMMDTGSEDGGASYGAEEDCCFN
jgi:transposase